MKKYEFPAVLALSLVLGAGMFLILYGNRLFAGTEEIAQTNPLPLATSPQQVAGDFHDATATNAPIKEGYEISEDIDDVLLLYNSAQPSSFDINFCKVAEYYGLLCKMIALDTVDLTDDLLQDPKGDYYKLIGIGASSLLQEPSLLSEAEITTMRSAISVGGANLLVYNVNEDLDITLLSNLTGGAITGAKLVYDSRRDWIISSNAPEITREFSGRMVSSTSTAPQSDFALLLEESPEITTLISSKDNTDSEYPIFIRWVGGKGSIFVDSGERGRSLSELALRELYYDVDHFSSIMPLMFTIRYTLGEETWHHDGSYANLTIDDPTLIEPFHKLSYVALFQEMEIHNFHTTIALIPGKWQNFSLEVVDLFLAHPERYSLVQHGNNHDGYEFYKYNLTDDDPKDDPDYRARPLVEQEADILEGLNRLTEMRNILGVPFDQVMIFPHGISPAPTMRLLKKYNYLATVNLDDVPLDSTEPSDWDFEMFPAIMNYEDFPVIPRRFLKTDESIQPKLQLAIFDLFLGKPALFFTHAYEAELFGNDIKAFNPIADQINGLYGDVEWQNFGTIIKHLFLEKTNDDGSVDIKMYGNHLIITNKSETERTYHIYKDENLNVSIVKLTVNNQIFPYTADGNILKLDVAIPSQTSIEINIQYGN